MNTLQIKKSLFAFGIIFFIMISCFGWIKLHYGFNFIDEGYHMTESWRLTQGDQFLDNKSGGVLRSYTLLNSIIFKLNPSITLLGFRKIQLLLTIMAVAALSLSLYFFTREAWHLPMIFSVFAFTGLDPIGMIPNLNYYTYPHLFLAFFLSFFLLALKTSTLFRKRLFYILSGICLWLINISVFYMGVVLLAPILLFLINKTIKFESFAFGFRDLLYLLAPYLICWAIFLGFFQKQYISEVLQAIQFFLATPSHSVTFPLSLAWYTSVSLIFLILFWVCLTRISSLPSLVISAAASVAIYLIISTSFFGLIEPYYRGWFGRPMWFASLIMGFFILFLGHIGIKIYKRNQPDPTDEIIIVLLIPVFLMAGVSIIFSGLKALTILHAAIPAVAAMSYFFLFRPVSKNEKNILIRFIIIILFLAPFYYTTARADWQFTYFDLLPRQADQKIADGFGKGIKTNMVYASLHDWIETTAAKYSSKDDYMISYIVSPMTHMIARRRPSLGDSFIDFIEIPADVYKKSIQKMKAQNREPTIAYVFQRMPTLWPVSLEDGTFQWPPRQFIFKFSKDPVSTYIKTHMVLADQFYISKESDHVIQCYVDPQKTRSKLTYAE